MNARAELTTSISELGLEPVFKLVSLHCYRDILQRISSQFTTLGNRANTTRWWWEHLTEPALAIRPNDPVQTLQHVIPANEQVWFLAEDWSHTKSDGQFWLYESTIEAICKLVNASRAFEFYVVSKKLSWLICVNHHEYVVASGQQMVSSLQVLGNEPAA